jgi:hypothetical protein
MGTKDWLRGIVLAGMMIGGCTQTTSPPLSPPLSPLPSPQSPSSSLLVADAPPLPVADSNGNYRRSGHRTWRVVDADPNGLNCRWSRAMPTEWYSPAAQFPNQNFGQWSVVRRFPPGTILTANLSPAGFEVFYDVRQQPWLKVSIGENEQICLVRANEIYIQPVAEPRSR